MKAPYLSSRAKSTQYFKLRALPTKPPATLRLGGMEPSLDMPAGEYLVACQSAAVERGRVVIHYQVIEGPYTGTALRQWISIPESGTISPTSRYAQQAAVALGRPVDTGDNLNNPASIFGTQIFRAFAGFRKTERPRGGRYVEEYALTRKDVEDGLRVHALISREEL